MFLCIVRIRFVIVIREKSYETSVLKFDFFRENRGDGIATVRPHLVANRESVTDAQNSSQSREARLNTKAFVMEDYEGTVRYEYPIGWCTGTQVPYSTVLLLFRVPSGYRTEPYSAQFHNRSIELQGVANRKKLTYWYYGSRRTQHTRSSYRALVFVRDEPYRYDYSHANRSIPPAKILASFEPRKAQAHHKPATSCMQHC